MKGDRPRQPHMAKFWDESQAVGRTDVTDLLEETLDRLESSRRLFPDLYAHKLTEALIKAGFIPPE